MLPDFLVPVNYILEPLNTVMLLATKSSSHTHTHRKMQDERCTIKIIKQTLLTSKHSLVTPTLVEKQRTGILSKVLNSGRYGKNIMVSNRRKVEKRSIKGDGL